MGAGCPQVADDAQETSLGTAVLKLSVETQSQKEPVQTVLGSDALRYRFDQLPGIVCARLIACQIILALWGALLMSSIVLDKSASPKLKRSQIVVSWQAITQHTQNYAVPCLLCHIIPAPPSAGAGHAALRLHCS